MTKLYALLGTGFLGALFWIQYTGFAMTSTERVPNVPKNIRNNPGAYRSHYSTFWVSGFGGK